MKTTNIFKLNSIQMKIFVHMLKTKLSFNVCSIGATDQSKNPSQIPKVINNCAGSTYDCKMCSTNNNQVFCKASCWKAWDMCIIWIVQCLWSGLMWRMKWQNTSARCEIFSARRESFYAFNSYMENLKFIINSKKLNDA